MPLHPGEPQEQYKPHPRRVERERGRWREEEEEEEEYRRRWVTRPEEEQQTQQPHDVQDTVTTHHDPLRTERHRQRYVHEEPRHQWELPHGRGCVPLVLGRLVLVVVVLRGAVRGLLPAPVAGPRGGYKPSSAPHPLKTHSFSLPPLS